ncbi:MAG: 3-methyl-2-oxobutanoate hydroxymethyltransferase [Gammaproteobacteria bacterium]|nr:3-methyl-2-oxobutanoate hydroxymethyltransferase [Gammaproteobacteria bacterium]
MSTQSARQHVTLSTLNKIRATGQKFACLTAYDACFTSLMNEAAVEVILVGDSLGMVLQGHGSTLPVTMADMVYHTECVKRANTTSFIMTDMPFMSYSTDRDALDNAAALMRAGAEMVKLEGGAWLESSTRLLAERGIPVCVHMGLTPQSINRIGGYLVQGRDPVQAENMIKEALQLQDAGASILLLECVPTALAKRITEALSIPVIGIGAGPHTTGQVLVMHDLLGISPIKPKFVKNFLPESDNGIAGAIKAYADAVKDGSFPAPEHCFD